MTESNLNKIQQGLLALLSINVSGKSQFDFSCLSNQEWQQLYEECKIQTVTLQAFDALKGYEDVVPTEVYKKWYINCAELIIRNAEIEIGQKSLVDILEKNGVKYVIIKGMASALYYSDAGLKIQGDIDFLVEKTNKQKTIDILSENGYTLCHEENDGDYHLLFEKDKVFYEMHFDFPGIPKGERGQEIKKYMSEYKISNSCGFNTLTHEYHAMCILLHMIHHMCTSGFGLRHLLDWVCFANKTLEMDFWKEKLIPKLKEIGLYKSAIAFNDCAVKFFGVSIPDWSNCCDDNISCEIMNDIFEGGNFGNKNKNRSRSGYLISSYENSSKKEGKMLSMLRYLHSSVVNYPCVKRCVLFYPFVFLWRVVRYYFLVLTGKRSCIKELDKMATKRKQLYDKLHIFEEQN